MKVLVIGGGGREHVLCWKIAQSKQVNKLYCAPGNGGTDSVATNVAIADSDLEGLLQFAREKKIDLTVVGPELPLTLGIVDLFEEFNLKIFGPNQYASQLEGSKSFAKEIMQNAGVPTARYHCVNDLESAMSVLAKERVPVVIKADGLAGGKGVQVCATRKEAEGFMQKIFVEKKFSKIDHKAIIEECLEGEEVSILALIDGETITLLPSAQDHKRIGENDTGPNTGGMGAYSPAPLITASLEKEILTTIIHPTIKELKKRNCVFKGILYVGLMMTAGGPKVLEFNVRFGDPEAQAVLMRLGGDFLEILMAAADTRLREVNLQVKEQASMCVVLCSDGYPEKYASNKIIEGLQADNGSDVVVFHAGTKLKNNEFRTSGGRVLGVTGLGKDIAEAKEKVYEKIRSIQFDGMHFRKDIGFRALKVLVD